MGVITSYILENVYYIVGIILPILVYITGKKK